MSSLSPVKCISGTSEPEAMSLLNGKNNNESSESYLFYLNPIFNPSEFLATSCERNLCSLTLHCIIPFSCLEMIV